MPKTKECQHFEVGKLLWIGGFNPSSVIFSFVFSWKHALHDLVHVYGKTRSYYSGARLITWLITAGEGPYLRVYCSRSTRLLGSLKTLTISNIQGIVARGNVNIQGVVAWGNVNIQGIVAWGNANIQGIVAWGNANFQGIVARGNVNIQGVVAWGNANIQGIVSRGNVNIQVIA